MTLRHWDALLAERARLDPTAPIDLGPANDGETTPLSLTSGSDGILDLLLLNGRATLRAAAELAVDLRSATRLLISVATRSITLREDGLFSCAFVRRFTMDGGQRQVFPAGSSGAAGSVQMDFDVSEKYKYGLSGDVTFLAPLNVIPGATYTIKITQNSPGGRAATWDPVFKFGALNGTLSTASGAVDVFVFEGSETGALHCLVAAKGVHA